MQFSAIVGQEEIKQRLIDEVRNEKVSHAQMLLGKPGYGGLGLAIAFVQYLLCKNPQESDSCGTCSSCVKVQKLQHPDLHFVFPVVQSISKTTDYFLSDWREMIQESPYFDLNDWTKKIDPRQRKPIISVHESDEIIKKLSLHAFEGGYKAMIIWMPEEMNISSANKLLKILEEPPKKTVFILVAEAQEKLMATIISRTQTISVPHVDFEHVRTYLQANNIGASSAESIASRVEGDILKAKRITGDQEEQDENRDYFIQLMRVCYKKNVIDMMNWAEDISAFGKERQKQFLLYSIHMFRQSLLKNYTNDQLTRVSEEEDGFLQNFARFITGNNIMMFTEAFDKAVFHIDRNANSKILFTNLSFDVMRFIHVA